MGGKNRRMMRPGLRASLHEMRRDGVVERRMAEGCGVENVPAQAAIARGRFDEIEPGRGPVAAAQFEPEFGEPLGKQRPEDRPDIDAGKEIARAARPLGRTGVVADLGRVEREVHELGHRDGAPLTDAFGDERAAVGGHRGRPGPVIPS